MKLIFHIDETLMNELRREAKRRETSLSELARSFIIEGLKAKELKKDLYFKREGKLVRFGSIDGTRGTFKHLKGIFEKVE